MAAITIVTIQGCPHVIVEGKLSKRSTSPRWLQTGIFAPCSHHSDGASDATSTLPLRVVDWLAG